MATEGSRERLGVARCAVAALLFGATTPLAARIADNVNAATLAGLLYLGAAAFVLPIAGIRRSEGRILRRGGSRLVAAVVAGGLVGPLLLAAGLARTPASTASLLLNLELVATAVLAALFFGEHIGRNIAIGAMLVVLAGLTLGWSDSPDLRFGSLLIVAACLCWGLDNCVTADLDTIAPHEITLVKGLMAGTTNLVVGIAAAANLPDASIALAALGLGAAGYGASITLWVSGARDLGAARGQLVFSAAPFVGALLAWTALGEEATTPQLAAVLLAAAGVLLVGRSGHEHPHAHVVVEHEHEHDHDVHHRHHDGGVGRHSHAHRHEPLVHAHPHVPDLHHRHGHT